MPSAATKSGGDDDDDAESPTNTVPDFHATFGGERATTFGPSSSTAASESDGVSTALVKRRTRIPHRYEHHQHVGWVQIAPIPPLGVVNSNVRSVMGCVQGCSDLITAWVQIAQIPAWVVEDSAVPRV